ncbi:hypothetical protein Dimus_012585 [Dionaea muscipula]
MDDVESLIGSPLVAKQKWNVDCLLQHPTTSDLDLCGRVLRTFEAVIVVHYRSCGDVRYGFPLVSDLMMLKQQEIEKSQSSLLSVRVVFPSAWTAVYSDPAELYSVLKLDSEVPQIEDTYVNNLSD